MKGIYILVIYLNNDRALKIGALGTISFKKGYYLYIGSAMGTTGSSTLPNRVLRHVKPSKNKEIHWHIDYLLDEDSSFIIKTYLIPSSLKLECLIAQELFTNSDGFIIDWSIKRIRKD